MRELVQGDSMSSMTVLLKGFGMLSSTETLPMQQNKVDAGYVFFCANINDGSPIFFALCTQPSQLLNKAGALFSAYLAND
jgi:hypothetical protein